MEQSTASFKAKFAETMQKEENKTRRDSIHWVSTTSALAPPEIAVEPMEFLSRSWSMSAKELSKSLASVSKSRGSSLNVSDSGSDGSERAVSPSGRSFMPFRFASNGTAQLLMEQVLSPSDSSSQSSRKSMQENSAMCLNNNEGPYGSSSGNSSSRNSTNDYEEYKAWCLQQSIANPEFFKGESMPNFGSHNINVNHAKYHYHNSRGKTVGRWLKDIKEKKKEDTRIRNAQVHAAVSVAGVAAALAAVATATANENGNADGNEESQEGRMSAAVASAAALVAAQCVETAKYVGADRDQIASMVASAVNVRNPGDIVTLTAGAATALRGAATLNARLRKEELKNDESVGSYEKGSTSCRGFAENSTATFDKGSNSLRGLSADTIYDKGCTSLRALPFDSTPDHSDHETYSLDYLAKGGDLLKRTSKGVVYNVWPGDTSHSEPEERHSSFSLKTDGGLMEFDCKNQKEQQLWIEGIKHLLSVADAQKTHKNKFNF